MKIVNKKKFIKSISTLIISIVAFITLIWMFIEFCTYPEKYLTTWRYQLKQEISQGDQEAIDYYQKVYLDNGQTLWD